MKKLLRILPVIFLMAALFACSKDKGTFTPPYLNGDTFTPPYAKPPHVNENRDMTVTAPVKDSTKNRDF